MAQHRVLRHVVDATATAASLIVVKVATLCQLALEAAMAVFVAANAKVSTCCMNAVVANWALVVAAETAVFVAANSKPAAC
jgi:hypothetical protein